MAIRKHEFYEGAALHQLAKGGRIREVRYESPFFIVNGGLVLHLKYSTKSRGPWAFTFMPEEQAILEGRADHHRIVVGLVCGADGVVALDYRAYREIASPRAAAVRIACARRHREQYEVSGPEGVLGRKVALSDWCRILDAEEL